MFPQVVHMSRLDRSFGTVTNFAPISKGQIVENQTTKQRGGVRPPYGELRSNLCESRKKATTLLVPLVMINEFPIPMFLNTLQVPSSATRSRCFLEDATCIIDRDFMTFQEFLDL